MVFIFAVFFYFYLSPENLRGIGEFCEGEPALLLIFLAFAMFVFPYAFPFVWGSFRNCCVFPCDAVALGNISRMLFRKFVCKSSAKMREKAQIFIACLSVCSHVSRAHNPEVVGSNPASATTNDTSFVYLYKRGILFS